MKQFSILLILSLSMVKAYACDKCANFNNEDFQIRKVSVEHSPQISATIWEITVKGEAGKTTPVPVGQLNGAPILAYVFPTSLQAEDVGFSKTEGIVALALTSHPDFDDTPLWDENADKNFGNDGLVWHPHWVVLVEDKRVPGGLAVKQFDSKDTDVVLPTTNPGMPMYMDSPGFHVITRKNSIKVIVADYRLSNKTNFSYDDVTVFMQVNTGGEGGHDGGDKPMLGVYKVYSIASGNLSLPYKVK